MIHLNKPHSRLAHLGCTGLVFLTGLSGSTALLTEKLHSWLLNYCYAMPLFTLTALAAAYLLEHALSTKTMLSLLLASAIGAGLALAGFLPAVPALVWQLVAGPMGYFATVALVLHLWPGRLYDWQQTCIFLTGSLLLPGIVCLLSAAHPVTTLCALGAGFTTTAVELCVFHGRDYFEITSTSRQHSTVISMVMLIAVPIYQVIWISLRGSYRAGAGLFRIFFWWW